MAKLKYPLQTLFDLRERTKKEKEEEFAKAKQQYDEALQLLEKMKDELVQMIAGRKQKQVEYVQTLENDKGPAQTAHVQQSHVKGLLVKEENQKTKIESQKEVVDKKKQELSQAQEEMIKATQEFKALEKHREKWQRMEKRRLEGREQDFAEDLSLSQFVKKAGEK